jgi:hypothetical protein
MAETGNQVATTGQSFSNTELTLRDIIAQNTFSDNEAMLKQELTEANELFTLVKGLLMDEVGEIAKPATPQRMGTVQQTKRRNMMFISSQTTNLISIKNLKMSLITKLSGLQQDQLDRNIRALSQIAKENKIEDSESNPTAVLDFILNNLNITIPIAPALRAQMGLRPAHDISAEVDLDSIIDAEEARENESKQEKTSFTAPPPKKLVKPKVEPKVEEPLYKLAYDDAGNTLVYNVEEDKMVVVDGGYEIIKELQPDEYEVDVLPDGSYYDKHTNTLIELIGE